MKYNLWFDNGKRYPAGTRYQKRPTLLEVLAAVGICITIGLILATR